MIRLDSATRKLQAVLGGAVSANEVDIIVSYRDESRSPQSFPEAMILKKSNGTTPVDICPAPEAAVRRWIELLSIHNTDTASVTVTVQYSDDGTVYKILTRTLAASESLLYSSS